MKATPKEVFNAVRTEESVIDFQQLLPMPDDIKNSDEKVEWHGMILPVWEVWAIEHWGTCKNACAAQYFQTNAIDFDTPWCEPEPIFEALAKRFPGHQMVVISDYLDWGIEEYEVYRIKNGSVISEGRHKYEYAEDGANFNRLETMRDAIIDFLSCVTTDPYLDNPGWAESEIQRGAERLKEIRVRRAQALQEARAKGWRIVYGKQKTAK